MKLILTENVSNLGGIGEVVTVRDGYGRNFLLPRKLAILANSSNESALKHHMALLEKKREMILKEAKALADKVNKASITVTKSVGEDERIFGSVTSAEVADLLKAEGFEFSKKDIHIKDEIKKIGVYAGEVKLHPEVTATFKIWVVAP